MAAPGSDGQVSSSSAQASACLREGAGQPSRAVLIVDDDLGTRETFTAALKLDGYAANAVPSGADALSWVRTSPVDAAVIDLRLPDMSGTDLARRLGHEGYWCPFILISGFLTTSATVEAMRLGASDVMDKPVTVDDLCMAVACALDTRRLFGLPGTHTRSIEADWPQAALRSSAERWARAVLRVCALEGDPTSSSEWAHAVGLSYTSLRELCRILEIGAHDARDLARMLRAVVKARQHRCSPQVFLDVADERTLRLLFQRAGLDRSLPLPSVEDWLRLQTFVDPEHPAVWRLRMMLSRWVPRDGSGV